MSCQASEVSEAVKDDLNAVGTWSQEFTAVRKWRVRYAATALKALKACVVPGPATFDSLDRRRDDTRYAADVVLLKRISPESNLDVDPLVALMEEIKDHYRGKDLLAGSVAMFCTTREFVSPGDSMVDEGLLSEGRVFVGVVRLHWRLRQ